MRRPRGPGGRFLTSEEIAAQKAALPADAGPSAPASHDGDEDDAEQMDQEGDGDTDMTIASPLDGQSQSSLMMAAQREHDVQRIGSTHQPPLQPRPQVQISIQTSHLLPAQPMTSPQASSPRRQQVAQQNIDHPMPLGQAELLTKYRAATQSHPPTPVPASPHSSLPDAMQQQPQALEQTHGHGEHSHIHAHQRHHHHGHDHRRTTASVNQTDMQPNIVMNGSPGAIPALPTNTMSMRTSYATMQMHHVPHPHAHARHHHLFSTRTQQLYSNPGMSVEMKPCLIAFSHKLSAGTGLHFDGTPTSEHSHR